MQLALLPREITPETVLAALEGRIGHANGMTACQLAHAITLRDSAADQRRLRQVVEHLRSQGHAVCAHPNHGYFLAANAADLDKTCSFLLERATTTLRQIAAMKRVALPDLRGQLGLPLTGEDDEAA